MLKSIETVYRATRAHWVGDGFPVRTLFSYDRDADAVSPFLLFDYAGPWTFEPSEGRARGVGAHPHKGFETVTIVYEGEVSHRDSTGGGGTIGKGEVQWMTAGSGVIHEEFHSPEFSRSGGPFRMVQLWINLPAKDKLTPAAYQAITRDRIPEVAIDGARARIIAGELLGVQGPASTFTPINMWDLKTGGGVPVTLPIPSGHTALIAVLAGQVSIDGQTVSDGEIARLSRGGTECRIESDRECGLLILTGEPIDEPVVGRGPFVMNTETEIEEAMADFHAGRFEALRPVEA